MKTNVFICGFYWGCFFMASIASAVTVATTLSMLGLATVFSFLIWMGWLAIASETSSDKASAVSEPVND